VRTQLNFIVRQLSTGYAFPRELTPHDVLNVAPNNPAQLVYTTRIYGRDLQRSRHGWPEDDRIEALRGVVSDARRRGRDRVRLQPCENSFR